MAISFQSDEGVLRKLRDKLRKLTDEELFDSGKKFAGSLRIRFSGNWKLHEKSGSAENQMAKKELFDKKFVGAVVVIGLDCVIDNRFTRRKGCFPTRGLWMSQIDGWYKPDSGRQYTIVGCPRKGCRIRAKAYDVDGTLRIIGSHRVA
jgi:hypothetical protein